MNRPSNGPWWHSASGSVTLAAIGAAALYLAFVHIDHVVKVLPLLFILACPLMHFFMHRGHAAHRHGSRSGEPRHKTDNAPAGDGP